MSDHSTIEWTDATWNPVTGCTKVSPGCDHCYAETFAERFRGVKGHPFEQGFDLRLWPERLHLPLSWRQPRRIFVNSMSDLFHNDVPDDFIAKIFDVMLEAKQHMFQVLTKRPARMVRWTQQRFKYLPSHIWLGTTVEADSFKGRIRQLQETPATVRFLSLEPLIAPIFLDKSYLEGIHWVIVGGESGWGARPMKPEWVYTIRNQCLRHNVPFFFKQWGAHTPEGRRVGKAAAGRHLDGKTWDGMPSIQGNYQPLLAGIA